MKKPGVIVWAFQTFSCGRIRTFAGLQKRHAGLTLSKPHQSEFEV